MTFCYLLHYRRVLIIYSDARPRKYSHDNCSIHKDHVYKDWFNKAKIIEIANLLDIMEY